MCRIGSIKSLEPVPPSLALRLMISQQEGHDNSGFAMVVKDLEGAFAPYKENPLLSMACTDRGVALVDEHMERRGFRLLGRLEPRVDRRPGLRIAIMPRYVFDSYEYPEGVEGKEEREELLLDVRLELRRILDEAGEGYVYSFWPDVLTLKEIGDPADIATYFRLWDDGLIMGRDYVVQCRQNTNYDIVRYAAHPFFLQGFTLCANGENTFYTKNTEFQKSLHRGYIGFESDSQNFLYSLHYVLHELKWPIRYYKHVITPLPFEDIEKRPDRAVLNLIRESLAHLEINGPNTIIGMLPDSTMICCCDSKKLRPVVVARHGGIAVVASEVCGVNEIMPDRDSTQDIYPNERELIEITNDLEIRRWNQ